jgi:hypothetical protein
VTLKLKSSIFSIGKSKNFAKTVQKLNYFFLNISVCYQESIVRRTLEKLRTIFTNETGSDVERLFASALFPH